MTLELAGEIEQLLFALEETQEELGALYRAKRNAIRRADLSDMERLAQSEQGLVERLKTQLQHRSRILQQVKLTGRKSDSLESVVQSLESPARDRLLKQIERTRRAADVNRRESWIVWIVSRQSLRLFSEIMDLIANGGRKAPVYSAQSDSPISMGGALLDASA